ncbi:nuclear transport factor 2 family protein [Rhodococcus qingshengii]|uniref:nuclear transport factor 2 family protein n=1 Tax=Rhodococcus qingshengii TaxID=334542 RepID=UPI002035C8F0|nr:nuclear transport factor 2 family protein [Rhodococcus qingshengii]
MNRDGSGEGSCRDFLDLLTDDVIYHEKMASVLKGKAAVWGWAEPSHAQFPGSRTVAFPEHFHLIDEQWGVIVAKFDDGMSYPGDGLGWAAHVSILTNAGNGKFSRQEDVYDVTSFTDLIKAWGGRAMERGTFDAAQRGWFEQVCPEAVPTSVSN